MNVLVSSTAYMFEDILLGLILTLGSGWAAIWIARRTGLLDIPGEAPHKLHHQPIPLAGGIALAISLILLTPLLGFWEQKEIAFLLAAALMVFCLGMIDDARSLSPLVKLAGQVAASLLVMAGGIYIEVFETTSFFLAGSGPVFFWLDRLLTILWLVGITNAFNLVDSMDGLAVGLSGWSFAFFMLATFDSRQGQLSALSAVFIGACLAIYFYNKQPARLFLGDSGAQMLGFLLAAVAILYAPLEKHQNSSWFVPVLLLGVPIFDTSLVFFSRLRRRRPFYQANLDHTYHRLVNLGLDPGRAVNLMHLAGLTLACLAFVAITLTPLFANLIFAGCVLAGLILMIWLDRKKFWENFL